MSKILKIKFNTFVKRLEFPDSFQNFINYIQHNIKKEDDSLVFKFVEEKTSKEIKTEDDYQEIKAQASSSFIPKINVILLPKEEINIKEKVEKDNPTFIKEEKLEINERNNDNNSISNNANKNKNENDNKINNEEINSKIHDVISSIVKEKMQKIQEVLIADIYKNVQIPENEDILNNKNINDENLQISMLNKDSLSLSIHKVKCNGCNSFEIVGPCFQCIKCPNYHLCSKCEGEIEHNIDHIFIKINSESQMVNDSFDIKYKNEGLNYLIRYYNLKILRNDDSYVKIKLINNGKINWEKGYKFHCLQEYSEILGESAKIDDTMVGNEIEIDLTFKLEKNKKILNDKNRSSFVSYWQMFNPNELPFGRVTKFIFKVD